MHVMRRLYLQPRVPISLFSCWHVAMSPLVFVVTSLLVIEAIVVIIIVTMIINLLLF